jgi:hypothetical protein
MNLIQVVPRLGPFDGIGDYAMNLARGLRDRHGATTTFIEAGTRAGSGATGEFEIRRSAPGSGAELAAELEGAGAANGRVLLHYVGYGYADRGAPSWLARAIESTRADLRYRLGVVFHEIYATGRPWQSAFWLNGLQKSVVRRVARACDGALLTREGNRRWLEDAGELAGKPVEVLPVPSAVGEPQSPPAFESRANTLVVWGSAAMKRELYVTHWPLVQGALIALGITRVDDIGEPAAAYPGSAGIEIKPHGRLHARDVGKVLGAARFGLVLYPPAFLAKSTLFAAYAAHGMVPLVFDQTGSVAMDGLAPGREFVPLARPALEQARPRWAEIATAARRWYAWHRLDRHVDHAWRITEPRVP